MAYRVLPGILSASPSRVALAPRHEHIEDAFQEMGTGIVVDDTDGRLVAFHGQHLRAVPAYLARHLERTRP